MVIQKHGPLRGELAVPGDKSISHRSVMFGALSEGITEAENFLTGARLPFHDQLFPADGHLS